MHEQEVVIVGYTEPRKSRKYFGALVLAVRDKVKKRWVYAGHVGAGFDHAALKSLYRTMQPLHTNTKPFDQKIKNENTTTWLIPNLVGEVKFTEWTSDHEMRHPVFLGLRNRQKGVGYHPRTSVRYFSETGARGEYGSIPIAPLAGQFQDRNQKEAPSLACNVRVRTRVWAIHLARVVCLVTR